jgi:hypothetical protein
MLKQSLIIFLLFLVSCKNEKQQFYSSLGNKKTEHSHVLNSSYTKIGFPEIKEKLNISSILKISRIISLDMKGELLGTINNILFFKDKIIVFDRDVSNCAYLFDIQGGLISKIGNKGEGPSEYQKIEDVKYNEHNPSIDIWDSVSRKILKFSETGEFINEIAIDIFAFRFAPLEENQYIFYQIEKNDPDLAYHFITVDIVQKKVIKKSFAFENGEEIVKFFPDDALNQNCALNNFTYSSPHSNSIYSFQNGQFNQKYFVDFKDQIPQTEINFNNHKSKDDYTKLIFNERYCSLIHSFFENKSYLVFNYLYKGQFAHFLYNKEKEKAINFINPIDDIFGGALFFQPMSLSTNDEIGFIVDPFLLKEIIKKKADFSNKTEESVAQNLKTQMPLAYQLYQKTNESSNPVIILLKINK